ncbi:hypothetical protein VOLCADRAFT_93393 [Volvox carteri f. nagariensis]|uniref:Uncharacterized protein n=1 Tax=Volvox carteri f. nagariensis TaxID=3068 RepID=D8U204_VOLCA|nr:uncharacterized protein VOLCADRAFT_93393 [Volvox carteri f. nagariensis]EFJ46277.1 hypothetical protein VOLCADRAFT_93393 [Volvox carteri f. nagariensis]|eukprot:XP_002952724.1 hypothetical protein VOLCADRAFT_93393 [Volvox carteri f. nagariensis]
MGVEGRKELHEGVEGAHLLSFVSGRGDDGDGGGSDLLGVLGGGEGELGNVVSDGEGMEEDGGEQEVGEEGEEDEEEEGAEEEEEEGEEKEEAEGEEEEEAAVVQSTDEGPQDLQGSGCRGLLVGQDYGHKQPYGQVYGQPYGQVYDQEHGREYGWAYGKRCESLDRDADGGNGQYEEYGGEEGESVVMETEEEEEAEPEEGEEEEEEGEEEVTESVEEEEMEPSRWDQLAAASLRVPTGPSPAPKPSAVPSCTIPYTTPRTEVLQPTSHPGDEPRAHRHRHHFDDRPLLDSIRDGFGGDGCGGCGGGGGTTVVAGAACRKRSFASFQDTDADEDAVAVSDTELGAGPDMDVDEAQEQQGRVATGGQQWEERRYSESLPLMLPLPPSTETTTETTTTVTATTETTISVGPPPVSATVAAAAAAGCYMWWLAKRTYDGRTEAPRVRGGTAQARVVRGGTVKARARRPAGPVTAGESISWTPHCGRAGGGLAGGVISAAATAIHSRVAKRPPPPPPPALAAAAGATAAGPSGSGEGVGAAAGAAPGGRVGDGGGGSGGGGGGGPHPSVTTAPGGPRQRQKGLDRTGRSDVNADVNASRRPQNVRSAAAVRAAEPLVTVNVRQVAAAGEKASAAAAAAVPPAAAVMTPKLSAATPPDRFVTATAGEAGAVPPPYTSLPFCRQPSAAAPAPPSRPPRPPRSQRPPRRRLANPYPPSPGDEAADAGLLAATAACTAGGGVAAALRADDPWDLGSSVTELGNQVARVAQALEQLEDRHGVALLGTIGAAPARSPPRTPHPPCRTTGEAAPRGWPPTVAGGAGCEAARRVEAANDDGGDGGGSGGGGQSSPRAAYCRICGGNPLLREVGGLGNGGGGDGGRGSGFGAGSGNQFQGAAGLAAEADNPWATPSSADATALHAAAVCLAADLASSVLGLVPPPPTLLPPPLPPFHAAGDAPAAAGPGTEPMTSGSAGRNAADGVHAAITAVVRQLEDLVASSLRLGMLVAAAPGGMALRLVAPGTPLIAPYGAVQEGQLAPPQVAAPVVPAAPTAPQLVLAVEWLSLELEDDDRLCSRGSDGGTMGTSSGGSGGGSRSNIRSGVVLWVVSPGLVCRQGRGGEASLYADSTGDGSGNSALPVASTADGVRERVLIPVHVVGWSA